jgi:ABC-type polysaccharide/polyol phosphate transport system ATPase subunit
MSLIEVSNLSVSYESPRFAGTLLSQPDTAQQEASWLLEPVSFTIPPGSALGVIGSNGSGKSSLLKAVLGVIEPATGEIKAPDSTLGVLDLNVFFHPDFSGFENLFMMNACHGKSDKHLEERMGLIEEFSEIADFFHRPVREYSAGMRMRLGISYVLFQDFDFLVIDEVMAVGDFAFQRKCLSRLTDYLEQGKSVLISSHNLDEIACLCGEIILLDKGKILKQGKAEEVLAFYLQESEKKGLYTRSYPGGKKDDPPLEPHEKLYIRSVRFLNSEGMESFHFHTGEAIKIEVTVEILGEVVENPLFRFEFFRNDGLLVSATNNFRHDANFNLPLGEATVVLEVDSLNLLSSLYYVSISVWPDEYTSMVTGGAYDHHDKNYEISVYSTRMQGTGVACAPGRIKLKGPEELEKE